MPRSGCEPWDDPHNDDPRFQRVRLRTEVLPLLEDVLQGGVAEALARTAALVRDDLDALDALAVDGRRRPAASLDLAALAARCRGRCARGRCAAGPGTAASAR